MGDNSAIEWTDATWNPIVGCSVVSPGCTNCYAMKMAARIAEMHAGRKGSDGISVPPSPYLGLTKPSKSGAVWTGDLYFVDSALTLPLRWKRPRRIFVNSMSDLFHEDAPDAWIDRVFAVMALAPQHVFQVLTKRSARMREYLASRNGMGNPAICRAINNIPSHMGNRHGALQMPLPNVWLGVSCEDQPRADERRDGLAGIAAQGWTTFVSYEPSLGSVDWVSWEFVKWLISGGESGPRARPSHPDWHRATRDWCAANGITYFFKQWGEWAPTHPDWPRCSGSVMANDGTIYDPSDLAYPDGKRYGEAIRANHDKAHLTSIYRVGKSRAGRLLDGRTHDEMPARVAQGGA
jgi:protein gp37